MAKREDSRPENADAGAAAARRAATTKAATPWGPATVIEEVKVAQRASGGCWRTLGGLGDFAVVQSYLSTATKWGIAKIDDLRGLFSGSPWMPPGIEPTG